ncbi:hypothetical protein [Rhodoferax koreensis]|nr:hypothetical protein [Rhodoferax koreense]
MKLNQNDLESIKDRMQRGELTAAQANVEMVRAQRVRLVTSRLPADIRSTLNAAVKAGQLGHMKKAGSKPEAYFHPTFDFLAKAERNKAAETAMRALLAVCA